jgi:hypothetical protein
MALGFAAASVGCTADKVPDGLKRTPAGNGPIVRFDLEHKPLPEIPMPNNAAMWPDPTSRTGLRINASLVAPTHIEADAREKFDQLEGWGTFAPITVAFDKANKDDARPAIDLQNIKQRHQGDDYDFANDAVYVVNLTTGVPAVMDIGEGAFQYIVKDKNKYWKNDTRRSEENLFWDTVDETVDPVTGKFDPGRTVDGTRNGRAIYKPQWDTDFDGVIDRPNLLDPTACANQAQVALGDADELDRDRCIANNLLTWYERETDTLIMRPLVPLDEETKYAVVVTDRVVDPDGNPVRSPFDFVYYPAQEKGIEKLQSILSKPDDPYFGDIAGTGLEHVAFAWTFTTQPVQEDLHLLRDGLYGKGPFAHLSKQFPAHADIRRAVGKVDDEALAAGAQDPPGWRDSPECKDKVNYWRIVKADSIRSTLKSLASQGFGIDGPSLDWLLKTFNAIDHFAIGNFKSPFFITGGPKGTDPTASFDLDYTTGQGKQYSDTVQFLIAVPKETKQYKQPFPVAYYGHGYTSSMVEALGFAGSEAEQGIATVGMNAVFHGLDLDETDKQLARALFKGACEGPFSSAFLEGRYRDLNGDGIADSGGDYWTSYLFHTRDVVRQSAVDLLQMFRIFESYDGKRLDTMQSAEDPKAKTIAGDWDGDGTPDVGGPDNQFYAWGESLGGILAPLVAALDPKVIAAAPTSGSGGLLDVGARTVQGGAFEGIYLRNFGPLVVGVPASQYYDSSGNHPSTACKQNEISLRFIMIDVNSTAEVEFSCFDPAANTGGAGVPQGGTVLVTNGRSGEVRCARMDKDGIFRIGIPTNVGDKLEVQIWDHPDIVDRYGDHGCNVDASQGKRIALINQWGPGTVANGAPDPTGQSDQPVCTTDGGCHKFQNTYVGAGKTLRALVEGFGYIRQTPTLRRFMALASNIVDPGDPINYAPYYALKPMLDPFGKVQPPTGVMNIVTVGDMNVPLNSGIALGRAAGAVPFMVPGAAEKYPEYADYATPQALYDKLGGKTPNRVLVDQGVMEGMARLRRHPPKDLASCQQNMVPLTKDDITCHPNCTATDTSACLSHQHCESGRCVADAVSEDDCAQALYDVDVIDEGASLYGEEQAQEPLRLARIARPVATAADVAAVWAPRLEGEPYSPDKGAWTADKRVEAQLMAYIEPRGVHGFNNNDPCQNWQSGAYMINLIGHFFRSGGADVYYLSHPSSHECLGRPIGKGGCPFVQMP